MFLNRSESLAAVGGTAFEVITVQSKKSWEGINAKTTSVANLFSIRF